MKLDLAGRTASLCLALLLLGAPALAAITEDLVLHATHDTADVSLTVVDDTAPGFPQDGALTGTLASAAGQIGQALVFDGNEANNVSYGDVLDPGKHSYTISLWFNADGVATTQFLAGKGNTGSGTAGFGIFIESGTLIVRGLQNGESGTERFSQSIASTISAATWHHVAMVIDTENDVVRGYLDGSNTGWVATGGGGQTDTLVDGGTIAVADPLQVGRRSPSGLPFGGAIDDLAIFARALSAAELQQVYDEGVLGNDVQSIEAPGTGLRLHTSYDTATVSGGIAADTTGIAQNGILEGTVVGAAGQIAEALEVDGMDANHLDHGDGLDPGAGSYTVSLWFNADDVNVPAQYLASKGNAGSNDVGWSIFYENGDLVVRAKQLTAGSPERAGRINAGNISSMTWHHVVLVVDTAGDVLRGYLDGSDVGWVAGGGGAPSDALIDGDAIGAPQPLLIGRRSTAGAPFDGVMDDVAIWYRALSAAEVDTLYQNGLVGLDASQLGALPVPAVADMVLAALSILLLCLGTVALLRRPVAS